MPTPKRNTTWIAAAIVLVALVAFVVSGRGVKDTSQTTSGDLFPITLEGLAQQVQFLEDRVGQLELSLVNINADQVAADSLDGASAQPSIAVVTVPYLNVRKSPDVNSLRVGVLTQDARVEVLSIQGEWANINFKDKVTGWVSTQFLRTEGE